MYHSVKEIRNLFLNYFQRNNHNICPSSPLVPHNDPSLMFTNAGMVQFKNIFTGQETVSFSRAATSQKCVRAGGKHNDLDNVGYTARHHTFFEMLGNFSFGDYFKEEAINFAWEFLTKDIGISKDKLYVTIYHTDDEAFKIWQKHIKQNRIIKIKTNDNFWSMGDTGPCGPCSEIFFDHGDHVFGGLPGTKDEDGDRFVEIWNLVFMQFEQLSSGEKINLPKPSIDTGMGLERISAVLQGRHNNYEIDLFQNLIHASQEWTKDNKLENIASHRIIADHLRSSSFLIADGVMPSNEGRGYVLRRIMRRAMRHIHQLGNKEIVMYKLLPTLINEMGDAYPELVRAKSLISEVLKNEEETFNNTLSRGLKLLNSETANLSSGSTLNGEIAFKLYDTYGFPIDLTKDILRNKNINVDEDNFNKSMQKQKERAKANWTGSGEDKINQIWFDIHEKFGATEFLGYQYNKSEANIVAIIIDNKLENKISKGQKGAIIFNQTPFYAESGGQEGDKGYIFYGDKKIAKITDTKKYFNDLHVHNVEILEDELLVDNNVSLAIDEIRRNRLRANHSATHLLHAVLRKFLGDHVVQKGSLVAEDKLRFDFSYHNSLNIEQINDIEQEVNRLIRKNSFVNTKQMTPKKAIENGAMALFGEKYGDEVRVVSMGGEIDNNKHYSFELCGGTHAIRTGDIALFKITSESAIAAGIRRIEALTGDIALNYLNKKVNQINIISEKLKIKSEEILPRIDNLLDENKLLKNQISQLQKNNILSNLENLKAKKIADINFIGKVLHNLPAKEFRDVVQDLINNKENTIIVMSCVADKKVSIITAVSNDLIQKFNAVDLVKIATESINGKGGGGRPNFAQSGAADNGHVEDTISSVENFLQNLH